MNFGELKSRLRRSVKNPSQDDVSDEELGEYINYGYKDLAGRYAYHQTRKICTFSTVAGESKYQLPPDCASVLRLRDNTHGKKLRKSGDRGLSSRGVPEVNFWPSSYVRYRNYVNLRPVPDGIYVIEIYYIAIPQLLVNDTDLPVLPDTWDVGVWLRAIWYYHMTNGDTAQATTALTNYTVWLSDKPSEIEEESVDIDSSVEVPELASYRSVAPSSRFDDGLFDFRD
jgi:hypothetical protein